MTKFRATLATFACATAIIVSAGTTPAAVFSELQGITTEIKVDELPPAPKLAPRTVPSAPLTIRKEKDISTPLLQQALPSAPAAKLKSIKAK